MLENRADSWVERPGQVDVRSRYRTLVQVCVTLLMLAPVLSLAYAAIAWLHYGIDLPYYDDWRQYLDATTGSFRPKLLFRAVNDTLAPVGLFLDALAFRAFDGNAIVSQLVTMVAILGALLALQWHLLMAALNDRRLAASAFSLTLLMLQPKSYWGYQNLAYHQALPLLFILCLFAVSTRVWRGATHVPAVLALTGLAGLSYISGAFATLAVSLVALIATHVGGEKHATIKTVAWWMLPVSLATTCAQGAVIAFVQKGVHVPSAKLALPTEGPFWWFMFGLIGRSAMLNTASTGAWIATGLVVTAIVGTFGLLAWHLARGKLQAQADARGAVIYMSLCAAIFVYLALVCAGRANLRSPDVASAPAIFAHSFLRFHYFWVTLLYPWLAAAAFILLKVMLPGKGRWARWALAVCIPVVAIPWMAQRGAMRHGEFFRAAADMRMRGFACLLQAIQRPGPIACPKLYPGDLQAAYRHAVSKNASFTRLLSPLPLPVESNWPAPVYQLSATKQNPAFAPHNVESVESTARGYLLQAQFGPMLEFKVEQAGALSACGTFEVTAVLRTPEAQTARLFYTTPEIPYFAEGQHRVAVTQADNAASEMSFIVSNPTGFHDHFRIDPVHKGLQFELNELKVRCRRYL